MDSLCVVVLYHRFFSHFCLVPFVVVPDGDDLQDICDRSMTSKHIFSEKSMVVQKTR